MKLIYEGQCYLQKFDIAFLLYNIVNVPQCFRNECKKWSDNLRIRNTRDHFTFIGPFVDPDCVVWIESLNFIVCYNDYISSPIKTLNKRIRAQTKEARFYDESVHTMRREIVNNIIEEHFRATKRQAKKIHQELAGLEIMRDHLEHKIDFEFPDGYTPPSPPEPKRSRLLNRLFGHYRIP